MKSGAARGVMGALARGWGCRVHFTAEARRALRAAEEG